MYSDKLICRRREEVIAELSRRGVSGVDKLIKRLERAADKEEHLDILVEGRFALLIANSGFSNIEIEPFDCGPDIKVNLGSYTAYYEITRRRPKQEDYEIAESEGVCWASPDRTDNVKDKITEKLDQLFDGEINTVVIWSNTAIVGVPELEEVFKYIAEEIRNNKGVYKNLGGVILVHDEKVDLTLPDEIYLFVNCESQRQLPEQLVRMLKPMCRRIYLISEF